MILRRVTRRDVPLARGIGPVAGRLERLGEGDTPRAQVAAIGLEAQIVHHVSNPRLVRMETGEERGPRGAAAGRIVELGETQPAGRQLVEVGRGDLAAKAPEVGVADVVREHDDDVGPFGGDGRDGKPQAD